MKNLAHLLPVMDGSSGERIETASISAPSLQLVAKNDFILPPIADEFVDDDASIISPDRFQEGYDTGYALGLSQGRAQVQAEVTGKDIAIEAFIAQARDQWTKEQSQKISEGIAKALKIIEDEVSACVERCLQQMMESRMRSRALEDFSVAVHDLLRFGGVGVVTVHAPRDFILPLSVLLKDCPTVDFQESDQAQVWVRSGATLIEARLESWVKSFETAE